MDEGFLHDHKVGQAELVGDRPLFEAVAEVASQRTKAREAADDIIVSRENGTVGEDFDR